MEKMGVKAEECIAVEDSRSGTLSGTRAGIKVVGYVGPYDEGERVKMRKDLKEAGAVVIMEEWSDFFGILERIQKGEI
jgi:beta-phosphoglucomutase-like phosphatase (HAD superfamily)